ncbi:patatin-like phospholipase family protein, partial [Nodularia sp. UHCC 0506]|uniref:patatin-like phospholipase family protein n=1 Tax=Nodularia sp. UHCC 0506 TaxID=3110243 RepID=UPI002B20588E
YSPVVNSLKKSSMQSLKFVVTHVELKMLDGTSKWGDGTYLSGNLIEGTLKTGSKVDVYDQNRKPIKVIITTISNNNKEVDSLDQNSPQNELKLFVKLSRGNYKILEQAFLVVADGQDISELDFENLNPQKNNNNLQSVKFGGLFNFTEPLVVVEGYNKKTWQGVFADFDSLTTNEKGNLNWRNLTEIGIALQGGGVKGAFGVGALHYLAIDGFIGSAKNLKIASASTGSLTALILQENQGIKTTQKAIDQYLSLQRLDDMVEIRAEAKTIINSDKTGALRKAGIKQGTINYIATEDPNSFISGLLQGVENSYLGQLKQLMGIKLSLALLNPVEKKLNELRPVINPHAHLRMTVVSLNTGTICYICYINQKLLLLYPDNGKTDGDGFNYAIYKEYPITSIKNSNNHGALFDTKQPAAILIKGALTSGAFPAFFAPHEITFTVDGKQTSELFFDGGVKENLPIEVLSKDVKNIISIHCNPIESNERNYQFKQLNNNNSPVLPTWAEVAGIAADYTLNEVSRTDLTFGNALNVSNFGSSNDSSNIIHIAPLIPTLGLTEVVPFNIKATVWYGYMRAYDELFISEYRLDSSEDGRNLKSQIRNNTTEIYLLFKEALYQAATSLIRDSLYLARKEKEKGSSFINWGELLNEHLIFGMAFLPPSLMGYLQAKKAIIDTIKQRASLYEDALREINITQKDKKEKLKKAFMYGQNGFMNRKIYLDWFGVYEKLDEMRLASNKRERLRERFFTFYNGSFKTMSIDRLRYRKGQTTETKVRRDGEISQLGTEIRSALMGSSLFEGDGNSWYAGDMSSYATDREKNVVIYADNHYYVPMDTGYLSI